MFGVKTLLHLAVDLGLAFSIALLLLAGRKKHKQNEEWQNGQNLFHGKR
jgi:hypothetical protein